MKRQLLYILLLFFVPFCVKAQNEQTESKPTQTATTQNGNTQTNASAAPNGQQPVAKEDQYYVANSNESKPKTARPELPKSALDYMLQRPRVFKTFPHKKFGDHSFLEIGVGPASILGDEATGIFSIHSPRIMGTVMLGDWITPVHGFRLGFVGGQFAYGESSNSFIGGELDYMMNFTATAQFQYNERKLFEVYGIAGGEFVRTNREQDGKTSYGAHIGIQVNAKLGHYWSLFIEPRFNIYQQQVVEYKTWRKYTPAGSILLGTSYQVGEHLRQQAPIVSPYKTFDDGLFVSAGGGIGGMFHNGFSEMKHYKSAGAEWAVGKWFSPISGARLSLQTESFTRNGEERKMKNVGLQFDYLLNLTNSLGSYDPNRLFDMNLILGGDLAHTSSGYGLHWVGGGGLGLQGIVYLTHKKVSGFYLEPRIDIYGNGYVQGATTGDHFDARTKVMLGFMLLRAPSPIKIRKVNRDYNVTWKNRWYLETGMGANTLIASISPTNPSKYLGPTYSIAGGKWFNAISGFRSQFDASWMQYDGVHTKEIEWKVDYAFNFSNAFVGYDPYRKVEFIGMAGIGGALRSGSPSPWFGVNGGLQALWHVNSMTALFLQPQFTIFNEDFMPDYVRIFKFDALGSVLAGVHFDMNGYNKIQSTETFQNATSHDYISGSAGLTLKPHQLNSGADYGSSFRIGYGQYYAPFYSIRYSLSGSEWNEDMRKLLNFGVGADFMLDVTTMAYNYDPNRIVNVRAFFGVDLNLQHRHGRSYFTPFVNLGGQLGVKVSDALEVYVEPSINRGLWNNNWSQMRANRLVAMAQAGIKYNIPKRLSSSKAAAVSMAENQYASLSVGPVVTTENATNYSPLGRKPGFAVQATYEYWINALSGLRAGLNAEFIKPIPTAGNEKGTKSEIMPHIDYLCNFNTLSNGGNLSTKPLQWIGSLGVGYIFAHQKNMENAKAPALTGGLQAKYEVTDQITVFAEPTFILTTKKVRPYTYNAFEGSAQLLIGVKYGF